MKSRPTRFRLTLAAGAVAAGLLLAPATAQARDHGRHGLHSDRAEMFHFILSRLDLTQEQQESIHEVVTNHHEETTQIHEEIRAARRALRQEVHADSYAAGAIRRAAADLAAVEVEMALSMGRLIQEIRQFLTPEQRERASQLIEDMHALHEQRRSPRRQGSGDGPLD